MRNIFVLIALLFCIQTQSQSIYKGLEYGMSKADLKKNLRKIKAHTPLLI